MKKLLLIPFMLFVVDVSAQRVIQTEKASDHSTYIKGAGFEGVVFINSYSPDELEKLPGTRFTPTNDEVIFVEKLLRKNLDTCDNSDKQSVHVRRYLKKYIRQYFGYINDKGEKVIYINGFVRDLEPIRDNSWQKEIVIIMDGGNANWRIKINLNTKSLFDFNVNGTE